MADADDDDGDDDEMVAVGWPNGGGSSPPTFTNTFAEARAKTAETSDSTFA